MHAGTSRIGISGWRYEPWRGVFYPEGLPQREELAFASRRFATIEINGSFYSLQRPEYYQRWHDETPEGFVFSVKGPRFVTHMLKLRNVDEAMANFFASGVANSSGPSCGSFRRCWATTGNVSRRSSNCCRAMPTRPRRWRGVAMRRSRVVRASYSA